MKGVVKKLTLGHANGKTILKSGDPVTSSDVDNFMSLVKDGSIELDDSSKKALKAEELEVAEAAKKKREDAEAKRLEADKANSSALELLKVKELELEAAKKKREDAEATIKALKIENEELKEKVEDLELTISTVDENEGLTKISKDAEANEVKTSVSDLKVSSTKKSK